MIPKGFLPAVDASQIFRFTEAAQGISFDAMVEHQAELNKIALADPNRRDFFSSVGRRLCGEQLRDSSFFI